MTYYVSINSHRIRANVKKAPEDREPPIRIATSCSDKDPQYASEVAIEGPARLIYNPEAPIMNCGARLVLVCEHLEIVK